MFFKTIVFKNFANFTGKHLGWSLKETPTPIFFFFGICEIFINTSDGCFYIFGQLQKFCHFLPREKKNKSVKLKPKYFKEDDQ